MTLSIIILSYNTKDLLSQCLNSIKKFIKEVSYEVIVVDNASTDGSVEFIKNKFPQIKLIKSNENVGFAKGINLAEKSTKGKYLLFLNSDTIFNDNNIREMIEFIDKRDEIGIVGGLLLDRDGSRQRSFGKFYNLLVSTIMLVGGDTAEMINYKIKNEPMKVDWVSGGFMLVRKELFERLKGFDENFFMYIEDMEFCYRMKKVGYLTYVYPKSSVLHEKHGSSNRSFAVEQIYKGLIYLYKKHNSKLEFYILKLLLTIKAYSLIIFGTITNNSYLKLTYKKSLSAIL